MNRYFEDNGCSGYTFSYYDFIQPKNHIVESSTAAVLIYEKLNNDIPVIARIGLIKFNRIDPNGLETYWHYIVITELKVDYSNDSIGVTCSSWGIEYNFNIEELFDSSWTGGLVYVQK